MKVKKIIKYSIAAVLSAITYNKIVGFAATINNYLKTDKGDFYKSENAEIYYEKTGEGSPVVLLHDLTAASSGYEWSFITEDLGASHTVYVPDWFGCGRSEKNGDAYSCIIMVKLLGEFLKNVVKEPAIVVTSGSSSAIALLAAQLYGNCVSKIICTNPAPINGLDQDTDFKSDFIDKLLRIPVAGTLIYNHYESINSINSLFENKYFHNSKLVEDASVLVYHEAAHRNYMYARYFLASERRNYFVLPVIKTVEKLSIPMDIIVSEENEQSAEKYREVNENININVLKEVKHLPHVEQPQEYLISLNL